MINSRKIEDLLPKVKVMCEKFIVECDAQGIDVIITSTYRDAESQNALYAQGRTTHGAGVTAKKPMGSVVTNAKAGQSYHNYKCAFDFVPVVGGKAQWSNTALFLKCGAIAKQCGLEWAGDWKTFKEYPHCQFTGGLTWKQLMASSKIPV